jgi:hypothetical protein
VSTDPGQDGGHSALATIGVLLLPVLCCGLPLLIAVGALGGVGSVLGNPWMIAAAVLLALAVVAWRVRHRAGRSKREGRRS